MTATVRRYASQHGQALAEGVVGLAALAVLFWAVPVVGRYQDVALASANASHHAAFLMTRADFTDAELAYATSGFFAGADLRWRDAAGKPLLDAPPAVRTRRLAPEEAAQPGGTDAVAAALRRDWRMADRGILVAQVSATARDVVATVGGGLNLARGTAVLTDAGHGASDAVVAQRVGDAEAGFAAAARRSRLAGESLAWRLQPIDAAWRRSQPTFDWLSDWHGLVPVDRLQGGR